MDNNNIENAQPAQPKSASSSIWAIGLAILILGGALYWYLQFSPNTDKPQSINWYNEVMKGPWADEIGTAIDLVKKGQFNEAIGIHENIKSQVTDPGQKAIIDLTIASIYFFYIDPVRGAEEYAKVAQNTQYPAISRAYAMLMVADQFDGLQDKNLLKPFFSESEFVAQSKESLIRSLYQRIYNTHPFGLAAGKLAFYFLEPYEGKTITDADFEIVNRYIADIDKGLLELETSDALKRFIPVTILMKAALFRLIENVGRTPDESVASVYLSAITRARSLGVSSTEQYGVLLYADYLVEKKNEDEAIKHLSSLADSEIEPIVKVTLTSTSSMQSFFPYLYDFILVNSNAKAAYQQILAD